MEIQKIYILPGQDVRSGFGAENPVELVQEQIRVFLFPSSIQPIALNFIPNFNFREEINPGLGSLKKSSFVKSPNFRQQCWVKN